VPFLKPFFLKIEMNTKNSPDDTALVLIYCFFILDVCVSSHILAWLMMDDVIPFFPQSQKKNALSGVGCLALFIAALVEQSLSTPLPPPDLSHLDFAIAVAKKPFFWFFFFFFFFFSLFFIFFIFYIYIFFRAQLWIVFILNLHICTYSFKFI
jgi:hypothetical protein